MTMTLEVNGERVSGFAGGSVTQSLDAIASTFNLRYGDDALNQSGRFVVEVGDAVKTLVDGDVLLDGYVMDDDRSYSSQSESASVSGVSRTGDVVESNAYVAGKTKWRNASLKEIVDALLDGYDVQARIDVDASPNFRRFAFHEGETIANAIKTAAAKRGALIVDDAGVLAFERAGQRSTRTVLTSSTVIRGSLRRSHRGRFSQYRFKGRTEATDEVNGLDAGEIGQVVTDEGVARRRLMLVTAFGARGEDLGKRAIVERNRRAGRGERYVYRVGSWRTDEGDLWRPNTRIAVRDDRLGINATLLISRTTHFYDERRRFTELELTRPAAFDTLVTYPTRDRGAEVRDQ